MRPTTSTLLFIVCSTTALTLPPSVTPRSQAPPKPTLTNITYWGSACPSNGLTAAIGPLNTTTNTFPLTFTLSNFLPSLDGSFGSSLRMCDIVGTIAATGDDQNKEDGGKWKVSVNKYGTSAFGDAILPSNATMFLRGSYSFAESAANQSIGMLDVKGPLTGQFAKQLIPEDADQGVYGSCGSPAELDIEFQARAVKDSERRRASDGSGTASWVLRTDVEVLRC